MLRLALPLRLAALLLLAAPRPAAAADNLACAGTGMDWYINMVGETPCQTYQKLRQICNTNFAVGVMDVNTPPDACTDQVSTCCCNTIAFALSMLCLNCQQNIGNSTGFDAGTGAYQIYLQTCSNPQDKVLPKDIQTAVCDQKIKINDDIYGNGGWAWTRRFCRLPRTADDSASMSPSPPAEGRDRARSGVVCVRRALGFYSPAPPPHKPPALLSTSPSPFVLDVLNPQHLPPRRDN
ncbi:hypothetical protein DFH09DRAFT_1333800 [Mycena vulgaris]|nr:hypothetical protein DFH09DRAFT_1333800 [Mycena vulgaris]